MVVLIAYHPRLTAFAASTDFAIANLKRVTFRSKRTLALVCSHLTISLTTQELKLIVVQRCHNSWIILSGQKHGYCGCRLLAYIANEVADLILAESTALSSYY